ncbi:hypothetical protein BJY04DRAFT_185039 [Aspergillus karnatakaensis]|uniref:uncharacterized protein n=1 Tax=Aspergillus karnatakaensis TaxID=1810916 RepID=UPI003CCD92C4
MLGKMHNPLPSSFASTSLGGECKKAERILDSFINPDTVSVDKKIPRKVLENARGLAIFSVFEVGMMRSLRFGSGLVVARLPNGTWSAPSAIATGKLKSKGQFGYELTDYVYVLNSEAAVDKFLQARSFTLGQGVTLAAGPFGRSAELAGDSYEADIFAYCKTRAVFGGSTLEGATMGERVDANRKMYQKSVTPMHLLRGEVTLPAETYPLMKILHSPIMRPVSRPSSVSSMPRVSRKVPQRSIATELPCDASEDSSSPVTISSSSSLSSGNAGFRYYEQQQYAAPHQITIEVSDYSAVELPRSLTSIPETGRGSLDGDTDGPPAQFPTVLKPGRRTWSGSSTESWSRHDPLHI